MGFTDDSEKFGNIGSFEEFSALTDSELCESINNPLIEECAGLEAEFPELFSDNKAECESVSNFQKNKRKNFSPRTVKLYCLSCGYFVTNSQTEHHVLCDICAPLAMTGLLKSKEVIDIIRTNHRIRDELKYIKRGR